MLTIVAILLYINLKTIMPAMGYTGNFFELKLVTQMFDWLVLITMVITVLTGIDYMVKNVSILRGVLK